ncbi:SWIM zinc finger family protein [Hymenobacter sediminis]|uniref:SWIM zinc finger family protein n=1 Tax=Hymenobacter sediminis TaxID=2218621 RepID=UPI000DA67BC9|nr:SWIM zinc finger family protein [Hymenobacter sediminis]RPD45900.1 SWIM zinc finger family protein [Hymenobacter sediminis]
MTSWTEEQARALITDSGTLKRGLELAAPAKWSNLGRTDTAAWGECKGSGSKPYQTGLDLTEPAFKCSCPSRVFPCKHGAGLLLLLARQPQLLSGNTPPDWLQEWLDKRQQTTTKKAAKEAQLPLPGADGATPAPASSDSELARQKREAQRMSRMQRGAGELAVWLLDLVRAGLAATDNQPLSFWENQAARLVDNQLPGLAGVVRELPTLRHQGADWPERMLARLGELYLLTQAFQRLPELPEAARQELLQLVGVNLKKEDILASEPAVADEWRVLSVDVTEEDRLTVRRCWLQGQQTGRYALVVEFSFGGQAFATALVPDGHYTGTLTFYPGLLSLRAVPGSLTFAGLTSDASPPYTTTLPELLDAYANALARQPWLREWPVLLTGGTPTFTPDGRWVLQFAASPAQDSVSPESAPPAGQEVPLLCDDLFGWELQAVGGGVPLTVFGEWTGRGLRPLVGWGAAVETSSAL